MRAKLLIRGGLIAALLICVGVWVALLAVERSYQEPGYSLIEDSLYLGGSVDEPPPGTRAVVNLCGRRDRYSVDAVLWEPILEGGGRPDPDVAWLRRVVDFIAAQRKAGAPTYVHCLAGVNRSGAVVTAYLMDEHGWGRDEALAFVRSKRSLVRPDPTLMSLLAEWEQSRTPNR